MHKSVGVKLVLGIQFRLSILLNFLDVLLKRKCVNCRCAYASCVQVSFKGCNECSIKHGRSCLCKFLFGKLLLTDMLWSRQMLIMMMMMMMLMSENVCEGSTLLPNTA